MEFGKIYNEDCLITMKNMPDNFVDFVITSPPYDDIRNYNGYQFEFEKIAKELYRILKQGGVVIWVVADDGVGGYIEDELLKVVNHVTRNEEQNEQL